MSRVLVCETFAEGYFWLGPDAMWCQCWSAPALEGGEAQALFRGGSLANARAGLCLGASKKGAAVSLESRPGADPRRGLALRLLSIFKSLCPGFAMPSSYVLGDHFESFVRQQLDSGRYPSE